jgi:hypothetical protein
MQRRRNPRNFHVIPSHGWTSHGTLLHRLSFCQPHKIVPAQKFRQECRKPLRFRPLGHEYSDPARPILGSSPRIGLPPRFPLCCPLSDKALVQMPLTGPETFRGYRDKCLRWAKAAGTEEERIRLFHMAEGWEQAAQQLQESAECIVQSRNMLGSADRFRTGLGEQASLARETIRQSKQLLRRTDDLLTRSPLKP